MRVRFKAGNSVAYSQDFRHVRGIPWGIVWDVEDAGAPGRVRLLADGYGYGITGRPAGNYGDGALYVARADLEAGEIVEEADG